MTAAAGSSPFSEALARAREQREQGEIAAALRELRAGLDGVLDYTATVTAARFLEKTTGNAVPEGFPARRVALIGSDTLTFLKPVLRTLAFRDGWWPVFYESPFGTWRQEILDPQSALRTFQPEVTLVWRGWRSTGLAEFDSAAVEKFAEEELSLARIAAEGLGAVLWPAYDLPPVSHPLQAVLAQFNERLRKSLPPGIIWANVAEAQQWVGAVWEDDRLWEAARQHPSPVGCLALAELWLALLRARWGQARKVLVTDLDNVMWGGIAGEEGPAGVRIGPESAESRAHLAYQELLLDLKKRGVVLAVCSKNNEADAAEIFARRAMPLRREDFAGWMVNWQDKAANLRALAEKLRLGLDSFVFVDDQPAERARVRQALPQVAVPELPVDPAGWVPILRQRRFFETLALTEEDRLRAASYATDKAREELRSGAATVEDFLKSLEMTAELGDFSEATLDRVEQLLARTNQWNLTTRRHGRADILALMQAPGAVTQWFRLKDRFGDHGLVGLWIARPHDGADGEWEIDSWVMSCRVIGRGLEELMFNVLVERARAAGARSLRGVYRPTPKSALVADLYPKFGFNPTGVPTAEEKVFTLKLTDKLLRPHLIRVAGQ